VATLSKRLRTTFQSTSKHSSYLLRIHNSGSILPAKKLTVMAWRSHGTTNATLVENLRRNGLITTSRVATAMASIDRAHFSPHDPYLDRPQAIGHAATISAPHMHANAAESLLPFLFPGARVLDVGSGSGYLTCVLAALVMPGGSVVGVEHIEALREMGERNARKDERVAEWVEDGRVRFVKGDGRLGWKEGAPWDAIVSFSLPCLDGTIMGLETDLMFPQHVGAAAAGFQQELVDQLKAPGR
jgi:protein-L-isoaspartate(D-aspartate) O-methyltransferase